MAASAPGRSSLTTGLVGLLGLTFPLFAVEYLRVGLGAVTLAAPVALCAAVVLIGLSRRAVDGLAWRGTIPATTAVVASLAATFWIWHVLSALRAEDMGWALRDLLKLATGLVCLWGVTSFVPPRRDLLDRFWVGLLWASAALVGFLIYTYAFVFKVPYLGSVLHEPSRLGKNQLTWYLVFVLPYAFAYWKAGEGRRLFRAVPLLVLVCGLTYAASRGAIAAVLVGLAWMSFAGRGTYGLTRIAAVAGLGFRVAVMGFVALQLLMLLVGGEQLEVGRRFLALTNPEAVPESHSVDHRVHLAAAAWDAFAARPVDGIGLTNSGTNQGLVTHNDYLGLLADTGAVGLLLFLALLAAVAHWIAILPPRGSAEERWWVTWGGRGAFASVAVSLLFINAYPNAILWTFWGLARVARRAASTGGAR